MHWTKILEILEYVYNKRYKLKDFLKRCFSSKKRVIVTLFLSIFIIFLLIVFFYPPYKQLFRKIATPYREFFYKFPEDKIGIAVARFEVYDPIINKDIYGKFLNADRIRAEIEKEVGPNKVEVKNFSKVLNSHEEAKQWGENKRACLVIWGHAQKGKEVVKPSVRVTLVHRSIFKKLKSLNREGLTVEPFLPYKIDILAPPVLLTTIEGIEDIEWIISKGISFIVGLVSLMEGNLSLAEKNWLSLYNEIKDIHFLLPFSMLYLFQGKLDLAYSACQQYLKIESNDPGGYFWLGMITFFQGKTEDAIWALKRSISLDLKGQVSILDYYFLGAIYSILGEFKEAIKTLKKAVRIYPNLAFLHIKLADVYHMTHNYTKAIKEYREALKIDKNFTEAYIQMARVYLDKGELDKSKKIIKKIKKKLHQTIQSLILLGRISEKEGELKKAETHFKRAIELYPRELRSYMELIYFYIRNQKIEEAEKIYKKIIDLIPEPTNFFNFSDSCDLYFTLVDLQFKLHKYKDAEKTCKNILKFLPWIRFKLVLARAYYLQGKLTKAEAIYKSIVQHEKSLGVRIVAVFRCLGHIYFKLGRIKNARNYYDKALQMIKDETQIKEIHYSLGLLYHSQRKFDKAMAEYKLALFKPKKDTRKNYRLNIISVATYLYLGFLYLDQKEPKKAIEVWKEAIPIWQEVFLKLLEREINGQIEEGRKKIKQKPEEASGYYKLAGLYVLKEIKLEDAKVLLEKAESLEHHPEHFILMALIDKKLGRIEEIPNDFVKLLTKSNVSTNEFFSKSLLD